MAYYPSSLDYRTSLRFECLPKLGEYLADLLQRKGYNFCCSNCIAGVFTFSTRMHERYLFPSVALGLLAFVYLKDKRFLLLTAGFSLTMYADTHYVLFETLKGINSVPFDPVLFLTSLFNVLLFGYLLKLIYSIMLRKKHYSADRVQHKIMD